VLDNKERSVGLRRGVYYGLAQAYTTLGHEAQARDALARSGASRLDPAQPVFIADFSVSTRGGFRFRPPRLVEFAPGVHVAQGFDFGDIGFVSTDEGIVAIDAGTTEETAGAALQALRRDATADQPRIRPRALGSHHGPAALLESNPQVIARVAFADELRIERHRGSSYSGAAGRRRYDVKWPHHLVRAGNTDGRRYAFRPLPGARGRRRTRC
jgi:hypothetical protein